MQDIEQVFTAQKKAGGITIQLNATRMGDDLLVALFGGAAHIGAVAVAQPRPSKTVPETTSATASVITIAGHHEDLLAREVALCMASWQGGIVTVVCGIHKGEATPYQIEEMRIAGIALARQCVAALQK